MAHLHHRHAAAVPVEHLGGGRAQHGLGQHGGTGAEIEDAHGKCRAGSYRSEPQWRGQPPSSRQQRAPIWRGRARTTIAANIEASCANAVVIAVALRHGRRRRAPPRAEIQVAAVRARGTRSSASSTCARAARRTRRGCSTTRALALLDRGLRLRLRAKRRAAAELTLKVGEAGLCMRLRADAVPRRRGQVRDTTSMATRGRRRVAVRARSMPPIDARPRRRRAIDVASAAERRAGPLPARRGQGLAAAVRPAPARPDRQSRLQRRQALRRGRQHAARRRSTTRRSRTRCALERAPRERDRLMRHLARANVDGVRATRSGQAAAKMKRTARPGKPALFVRSCWRPPPSGRSTPRKRDTRIRHAFALVALDLLLDVAVGDRHARAQPHVFRPRAR